MHAKVVRQFFHRHPIDTGTTLVLLHSLQRDLKVAAVERRLHQPARSWALGSMARRIRFDALLCDRRAEHVLDERLARSRIESAYARRRVKREVVETRAKRLIERERLARERHERRGFAPKLGSRRGRLSRRRRRAERRVPLLERELGVGIRGVVGRVVLAVAQRVHSNTRALR